MNTSRFAVTILSLLPLVACGGPAAERSSTESGPHRVVVRMRDDMTFEPAHVSIAAGDTVVWVNAGKLPHTTTGDPDRAGTPAHVVLPDNARPWDSGSISEGEEYRVVFTVPGRYAYVCSLHEMAGMSGSLDVRP